MSFKALRMATTGKQFLIIATFICFLIIPIVIIYSVNETENILILNNESQIVDASFSANGVGQVFVLTGGSLYDSSNNPPKAKLISVELSDMQQVTLWESDSAHRMEVLDDNKVLISDLGKVVQSVPSVEEVLIEETVKDLCSVEGHLLILGSSRVLRKLDMDFKQVDQITIPGETLLTEIGFAGKNRLCLIGSREVCILNNDF